MSDNLLRFIPTDPEFVPQQASAERALGHLVAVVPAAEEVTQATSENVQFVDPGANFERVSCPQCGQELSIEWWQDRMDEAFTDNFATLSITTPCCGTTVSLNDLKYEWPAGFARFVLEARNPGVADLTSEDVATLSDIVGSPLRRIWAHY